MMEKVFASQSPRLLVEKIDGKDYRVRFDVHPFEVEGEQKGVSYMEETLDHAPTIDEVKKIVIGYYNDLCDKEILSGFQYDGVPVWLSRENQINYKVANDLSFQNVSVGGEFQPIKFKFGTDANPVYKTFETLESLSSFVVSMFTYIQKTLNKYWEIKDNIKWDKYEEL